MMGLSTIATNSDDGLSTGFRFRELFLHNKDGWGMGTPITIFMDTLGLDDGNYVIGDFDHDDDIGEPPWVSTDSIITRTANTMKVQNDGGSNKFAQIVFSDMKAGDSYDISATFVAGSSNCNGQFVCGSSTETITDQSATFTAGGETNTTETITHQHSDTRGDEMIIQFISAGADGKHTAWSNISVTMSTV